MNSLQRKDVPAQTTLFLLDAAGTPVEQLTNVITNGATDTALGLAMLRQLRRSELQKQGKTHAESDEDLNEYVYLLNDLKATAVFARFKRGESVTEEQIAIAVGLGDIYHE